MNNHKKGFINMYILAAILLIIAGGVYLSNSKKRPATITNHTATQNSNVATSTTSTGGTGQCETEVAGPNDDIFTNGAVRVKVVNGNAYRCDKGHWVFQNKIMRTGFENIHATKTAQGCTVVNTSTGDKANLSTQFASDFELPSFLDLFKTGRWSKTLLLSPKADTDQKYEQLNTEIMKGGPFLDNRIDLVHDNVHAGSSALKFYAVSPSSGMVTSKSLVEKSDLCFTKGDDIWFSGWYYLEKGVPSTLVDFDTQWLEGRPGIRLFIRPKDGKPYASMELKFASKPQYNQFEFPLPLQKWTHIKLHIYLSNHEDGFMEMWQDDQKILSMHGQTLPLYDTVYNAMLVGITSTSMETVLRVDDVKVSNKPF
ncbi:MAG: heparin lyase I family protein [Minisyncoccota bacterium]